jgi:sulfofructose kinase
MRLSAVSSGVRSDLPTGEAENGRPNPMSINTFDVVGVGASCIDQVCRLPVFPEPTPARDKVRMLSQRRECGGQTATCLSTCASFGLRAAYVGVVGDDDDGRMIRRELAARGVDVAHVVTGARPSASATILIDATGERLVLWHRDADLRYPVSSLPRELIGSARLLHVDDVDESAALSAAECARAAGLPVTCDIDHVTPGTVELLSYVTHPVFAAQVPLDLTGERDHEAALRHLRRTHPGLLVVTLGDQGALALDGDRVCHAPAFHVQPVVDTTGAGDVFRGAFIHALLQGWATPDILRFANAAAAVSCTKAGAMGGVPSPGEVRARMAAGG